MNVLVACEASQEVCFSFRAAGHIAFSCDLDPCYGGFPEWHILADALDIVNGSRLFLTQDKTLWAINGPWDLVIAHPPCTYLSSVSASRLFNSDHTIKDLSREIKGWDAREFFMNIYNCNARSLCIENPSPLSYFNLPPYTQIIQPYYFGDPYKKRTCLWLRDLPLLLPTHEVKPLGCWVVSGGGVSCRVKTKSLPSVRSSRLRSKTFSGIAQAMALQWGNLRGDLVGEPVHELRGDLVGDPAHDLRGDLVGELPHELRGDLVGEPAHELRGDLVGELPHELRGDLVGEPAHELRGDLVGEPAHELRGDLVGEPAHELRGALAGDRGALAGDRGALAGDR